MKYLLPFLSVLSIVLSGCAVAPKQLYPGERLPSDKEAQLYGDSSQSSFGSHPKIRISKVDGKATDDLAAKLSGQSDPYPFEVFLLPGRHTVTIHYAADTSFAEGNVWFEAEAGKTYAAKAEVNGYKVQFWIRDNSTGLPVGGIDTGAPEVSKKPSFVPIYTP